MVEDEEEAEESEDWAGVDGLVDAEDADGVGGAFKEEADGDEGWEEAGEGIEEEGEEGVDGVEVGEAEVEGHAEADPCEGCGEEGGEAEGREPGAGVAAEAGFEAGSEGAEGDREEGEAGDADEPDAAACGDGAGAEGGEHLLVAGCPVREFGLVFFEGSGEVCEPPVSFAGGEGLGGGGEGGVFGAAEDLAEGFEDGAFELDGVGDGEGFVSGGAEGLFGAEFLEDVEGFDAGLFRGFDTGEPAEPCRVFFHGVGEAEVAVDFEEGDFFGSGDVAFGFSEVVVPKPDAKDEGEEGDQGFGVSATQEGPVGVGLGGFECAVGLDGGKVSDGGEFGKNR